MNTHLDTHVALWMAAGDSKRLKPVASKLRRARLFLSPVVVLELEILCEIGRIRSPVSEVLTILREDHGVADAGGTIGALASVARGLGWTRDPFDRLIAAHAMLDQATLLTADRTILEHCSAARWE